MSHAFLKIYNNKRNKNFFYKKQIIYIKNIIQLLIIICIMHNFWMEWNNFKKNKNISISHIIINGKKHYSNDEYIKKTISKILTTNNFFKLNLTIIKQHIKLIPWIQKIKIHKYWPNILKIYLTEYEPYAKWNENSFINKNGDIFILPKIYLEKTVNLTFFGPLNSQLKILTMYHTMQNELKKYNFFIYSIRMSRRESWQLILTNTIELKIGTKDIKKRLNRFIKIYPILKKKNKKHIKYIDLRYTNGVAVG
uniref:Cell division protein FtsQ n=1 Tax=Candidatus Aschnera chinzeii TaxID=1485666 RepID=A0AAT9G4J3_9ENTR|nr:MAG: cell division protein FtsQ [Candidatus Aschnera chinzeii]